MMRYVALMRGFGPGDPNMRGEKLKEFFAGLGFSNIHPVLASGNVVFDSDIKEPKKLEAKIEKALPSLLGFSRAVIVRGQEQLQILAAKDPFRGAEHSRTSYLLVTFFKNEPQGLSSKSNYYSDLDVNALCSVTDTTATHTPDFMVKLEKQFGKDITSRTWLTIQRILAKMQNT